jgi:predicted Zn-dependent peptidase
VDEQKDEQGMAHIVEHVTFLGSKKRDGLLGTGGRSNAYTDFHHTVFHVHSPIVNATTGERMLPQVRGTSTN